MSSKKKKLSQSTNPTRPNPASTQIPPTRPDPNKKYKLKQYKTSVGFVAHRCASATSLNLRSLKHSELLKVETQIETRKGKEAFLEALLLQVSSV